MRAPATAEVALVQLRSCLVNLPSSLAGVLVNANTAAQNVVVELQLRGAASSKSGSASEDTQKSIYVGWTGLDCQRRPTATLDSHIGRNSTRERDVGVIELDSALARANGISDGQKVGVLLHVEPQLAHTVNIEPLTPADWEIIELHATFLETNLQAQIRALPNPNEAASTPSSKPQIHPLTLHLSPTSTANIVVTSLTPPLPSSVRFAKLAPDAEVIVAPKSRSRVSRSSRSENQSITGASQKNAGPKSGANVSKKRPSRSELSKKALFLRGLSSLCFPDLRDTLNDGSEDKGLSIWVDPDILSQRALREVEWVSISIVHPVGSQAPSDPQQLQKLRDQEVGDVGKHASKIVARLRPWKQSIDCDHALLDPMLCASLGMEQMVGGIVRIDVAPSPIPKNSIKTFKVFPFTSSGLLKSEGLKFGGESKISRQAAVEKLLNLYNGENGNGLLAGAVTDGAILPKLRTDSNSDWQGGLIRFDPPSNSAESSRTAPRWCLCQGSKLSLEISHEISDPFEIQRSMTLEHDSIPLAQTTLIGIDDLGKKLVTSLRRQTSVLLSGGLGSGKTSMAVFLGHCMRKDYFYYVSYLDCRKLATDEARIGTIKEKLNRIFMKAAWGCKLGGKSLVVFDDLDKLCPTETELQVGGENGRSRQISELFCSIIHQYCIPGSGIVMLATSISKDALNSIIVGGHVVREFVDLKAPDKDKRRRILESLAEQQAEFPLDKETSMAQTSSDEGDWMDASMPDGNVLNAASNGRFALDEGLDFLKIAGETDGYMPGDLIVLLSRARNEAIIRAVSNSGRDTNTTLTKKDWEQALKDFTPASLRNVSLQSSSVTFSSIGGLESTRNILLETLQYPTTYAPIFAQCPLRLRSGLLLYGFPGCGKTLLASAVAGECGLNFISVKGPEILNKYIGASEKSVRDLFDRAEAARPCVLFFDEFDSIAPKRGHDSTGVTDRVVNQLLTQMDGAEGLSGVYVLAATSRPDLIDPALLRPGRLDKSLLCDMPNEHDRLDIMRALSKKLRVSSEILDPANSRYNLEKVAKLTEGFSGADLQALIYNAHLESIHDLLGDNKENGQNHQSEASGKTSSLNNHSNQEDFIQFRFGEEEDGSESSDRASLGFNRSKHFAERADLIAKLDYLKLSKRKEKALRSGRPDGNGQSIVIEEQDQEPEVVIEWKHLAASLNSTRSSISAPERKKLETIYRDFVVGRNGEMPSGQGPMEVGARSSLM